MDARAEAQPDPGLRERRGRAALVVSSLAFGLMAFFAKWATRRLPGPEVALTRFLIGVVACGAAAAAGVRLRPVNWIGLALRGLFGGAAVLLYFTAIAHLPVGTATLLNYTAPIYTAILAAIFLRERVPWTTAFALLVAFGGVMLVVRGNAPPGELGFGRWELCSLASALLSGAAVTTIRAVRRTDGSWEIFAAFCVVGVAATLPSSIKAWVSPTPFEWLLIAAVGGLSIFAQVLFIHALKYVRAATSGVVSQLTPVTALACGVLALGDRPAPLALVGSAVTLGAVAWAARSSEAQRT
jgi:drug/metabolite transporter (DMT)-like permease